MASIYYVLGTFTIATYIYWLNAHSNLWNDDLVLLLSLIYIQGNWGKKDYVVPSHIASVERWNSDLPVWLQKFHLSTTLYCAIITDNYGII